MTALGIAQLGGKAETTYGTPVTVDRFWPFISSNLSPDYAITSAADELRAGSIVERVEQDDPYIAGGGGSIEMYVPTKGFGLLVSHALGSASIGSITDSNYTQTFVLSATGKNGKSLTLQAIAGLLRKPAEPPVVTVHPGQMVAAAAARERIEAATTDAYNTGLAWGERTGYTAGWRIGMGYGLSYGTVLGAAAGAAALQVWRWLA